MADLNKSTSSASVTTLTGKLDVTSAFTLKDTNPEGAPKRGTPSTHKSRPFEREPDKTP